MLLPNALHVLIHVHTFKAALWMLVQQKHVSYKECVRMSAENENRNLQLQCTAPLLTC